MVVTINLIIIVNNVVVIVVVVVKTDLFAPPLLR